MKYNRFNGRLSVFSPELFLPVFVLAFYLAGLVLVEFSIKLLAVVLFGISIYILTARAAGRFIEAAAERGQLKEDYFERLIFSLLAIFLIDLGLKHVLAVQIRVPLYLVLTSIIFYIFKRYKINLQGFHYLSLGVAMILAYVVPSFAIYGPYGAYLNRTGGLMPAFLVGMGTIITAYGLMKVASALSPRNLLLMVAAITFVAGPLMAAIVGYRAYAIIYIMPLLFQYYLEKKPSLTFKAGLKAIGVIVLIFVYTYFATSVARGTIYSMAPLDSAKAPAFVVESMEKGRYTDKDMQISNPQARNKFITRPLFTYNVFMDVIEKSYPWGKSRGKLTLSLMPGTSLGRETTISILKKPLSTSFFGLSFLEFGFAGVAFYSILLGISLATLSRLKNIKIYALTLSIIMLWLDTGPSVWWHWLPFLSATLVFVSALLAYLVKPKAVDPNLAL